ncbi:unnamed protein product (mitochondrion) [Plasmodiophora brassicae]|uniref:Protein CLP1 homolog n=1 Tax=Plasmodiophora brassicae TaxID=37360 RepID=A0A0G4IPD0_PLABS|nr:hypothetical protein PBRA_005628 [Plasmodiophora brassicae]SPR01004.1 unnamed protein product [Plasmodiophora brassicae]
MEETPVQKFQLASESELRLETLPDQAVTVRLLNGTAELFGTELAKDVEYSLADAAAIYTWHGCSLEVKGRTAVVYISDETPMREYINLHSKIDALRESSADGPRVMIVGSSDSGKSTLARILLSYSVRAGRRPLFLDIDVGHNDIAIPGAVAATSILHPFDVEKGLTHRVPVVFFYGHVSPVENVDHYKTCVQQLGAAVDKRFGVHEDERRSGFVVSTCGWTDGEGYKMIIEVAKLLRISHIVVIGQDRLRAQLGNEPELAGVVVVKVPKSGGVIARDPSTRRLQMHKRVRQYFYGVSGDLCPHTSVLRYNAVGVYQVGGLAQAPSTMLPIGEERQLEPNQIMPVTPSNEFNNSILAVSQASSPEELLTAPVAGFVFVAAVESAKHSLKILAPCPGPLPYTCLLYGSLKWIDT